MMARSHALSGALVGLAAYALTIPEKPDLALCALTATLCAGYALLPDLDHTESTATRIGGLGSRAVSWWLRRVSLLAWHLTATRADRAATRHDPGGHRFLLHTPAFALALGLAVALATEFGGAGVSLLVYGSGIALADRALRLRARLRFPGAALVRHWPASLGLIGLVTAGTDLLKGSATGWPPGALLGVLVAFGCLIHNAGDAVTNTGVPLAWPVRVGGRRWRRWRAPAGLLFATGSRTETVIRWSMAAALVALTWSLAITP